MVRLALDGSTDSLLIVTRGKSEFSAQMPEGR